MVQWVIKHTWEKGLSDFYNLTSKPTEFWDYSTEYCYNFST